MSQPSVKKNYLYRTFYEILLIITPFITTPYITRVLGADGVGIFSATYSHITYFSLFGALGTVSYGAREIAQHRDNRQEASKLFWEIELLTVFTTGICLIIWIFVIIFSTEFRLYYIAWMPYLLGTMADISWFFTGYEKVKYIVARNSLVKILGIVLLFLLVKTRTDLIIYIIINSCVVLGGNLTMWLYIPKMVDKVDFRTLTFKRHFKETLIYFVPTIATSIYTVLDKTLIHAITGDVYQNGYYEEAAKLINVVKSFAFSSVNFVMGARLSYLFAQEKYDEIRNRIHKSMNFILLISAGSVFGLIGVARRFVPMFMGEEFMPTVTILYFMSPLILIIAVSNCLGSQYYTPGGQRKRSSKVIVLGAVVNLICNLLLIPKFGAIGATIGSLIAEGTITYLYVHMSAGYMTFTLLGRLLWKRVIAGASMCAVVSLLGRFLAINDILAVAIQVVSGVAIYGVILVLMKDDMLFELMNMAKKTALKLKNR